ncbi:MAG: hypothetical protein WC483_01045 [Candidatus Paceibacterota bacterium]
MFKAKKKHSSGAELFESAACEGRLLRRINLTCAGISQAKILGLMPYLIEDDRISCRYMLHEEGKSAQLKLLSGGYFRLFEPSEQVIYLSPFPRTVQLGLASAFGEKKFNYWKWKVSSIETLFIETAIEPRIRTELLSRGGPMRHSASMGALPIVRPK